MFRNFLFISAAGLLVSGCASTITAIRDGPITSDHLNKEGDRSKLKTVSGDRRLVRVQAHNAKEDERFVICAETQADAIAGRVASSGVTVNGTGSATDSVAESLILTNARGQVSDVVRQLAWQFCNAELNGAYVGDTKGGYAARLDQLEHDAMQVMMAMMTEKKPDINVPSPAIQSVSVTVEAKAPPKPPEEAPARAKKPTSASEAAPTTSGD